MLLECNPCLAKYSTFGGLNSPLHFAASKGHNEVSILNLNHFFFFFRFFHFGEFLFLPVFFDSLLILFIWVSLRLWHCCLKMELMWIREITVGRYGFLFWWFFLMWLIWQVGFGFRFRFCGCWFWFGEFTRFDCKWCDEFWWISMLDDDVVCYKLKKNMNLHLCMILFRVTLT